MNKLEPDLNVQIQGIRNSAGMELMVAEENTQPTLRMFLPGRPASDRTIEIIFPEHVTVRPHGSADANQLYLFQPGQYGERPLWRQSGRSIAACAISRLIHLAGAFAARRTS